MKKDDLPERWKKKLKAYLKHEKRETLECGDFDYTKVIVKYEDGSRCEYNYSFVIPAPEFDEIGVFTEHCGYHIVSMNIYTAVYVNGKRLPTYKLKAEYQMKTFSTKRNRNCM